MQVEGNKLKLDKTLWVQFEGVDSAEEGEAMAYVGRSDDSYVKVFNQFGRLLKLYTFTSGKWIDIETNAEPAALDESQAGRLSAQAASVARPAARQAAKPKAPAKRRASAAKRAKKKAAPKRKAAAKRGRARSAAARASTKRTTAKRPAVKRGKTKRSKAKRASSQGKSRKRGRR